MAEIVDLGARRPPETRGDYALISIREDLVTGRLRPGTRVTAEELAARLGVSHVPVREALRYLEAEGHLERDGRGRLRVRPTSATEADEIYRLRRILEAEANKAAVPKLTDGDISELEVQYAAMEAALEARDIARYAVANRRFHFIVFDRAELPWLRRFLTMVWDAAARYQTSVFVSEGWEDRLQREHRELLDAFRERNSDRANELMDEHRTLAIEEARRARPEQGLEEEEPYDP
jgi:DNA-binding GntR family transcriptional regulator